jgi:septum formation protein
VRLILASASPRRAELLRAAGFAFETLAVDIEETARDGEAPATYVRRLAAEKSARAARVVEADLGRPWAEQAPPLRDGVRRDEVPVILGADTTVVVDGEILGKPHDDGDASAMLRRLSGRRHDVLTGISLRRGASELGRVEISAVYFAPLTAEDIAWYVTSREGRDKAGAYAIQGLASRFIPRIEGSYSNVVGLPIAAVSELLRELHA